MEIIVSIIAVVVAAGCLLAIMASDVKGRRKSATAESKPNETRYTRGKTPDQ
jgi:hypothetical protein